MENPIAVLKDAAESLKPQGRIGIVDYSPGAGGPGRSLNSVSIRRPSSRARRPQACG